MNVRMCRQNRCSRLNQFLPSLPVANADLGDEKLVIGNVLLASESSAVPFRRIEFVHAGPCVNHQNFFWRQLSRGDHDLADLFAYRDDPIDTAGAELAAIPDVERKRNAAIHDERADRPSPRRRERQSMRDALVHMNDIRLPAANQTLQLSDAGDIELMAQRQTGEVDAAVFTPLLQNGVRAADDCHFVSTLAQSRRGLEHLVHRARVELIEFENVEYAHAA